MTNNGDQNIYLASTVVVIRDGVETLTDYLRPGESTVGTGRHADPQQQ